MPFRSLFFAFIFLIVLSCSIKPGSIAKLHRAGVPTQGKNFVDTLKPQGNQEARATYLGCGGLLLQKGNDAILIDPFFSNQKTGKIGRSVFLGRSGKAVIHPDKKMVELGLATVRENVGTGKVHAIVSAHSHYDHLMDVPLVYEYFKKEPKLLLTRSGYNIIHNTVDSTDVVLSEDLDQNADPKPFEISTATGSIRIYPIRADHNPHFRHVKFFSGAQLQPVNDLSDARAKTKANLWLEGNTFSFLVDFVGSDGSIEFRAFIQSSSCHPPAGIPPAKLLTRPVDVAFIGVVSYQFSPGYPCELLNAITPGKVVWIHWEDFFRRYDRKPKTVRGTDIPAFFSIPCVSSRKNSDKILWPRVNMKLVY